MHIPCQQITPESVPVVDTRGIPTLVYAAAVDSFEGQLGLTYMRSGESDVEDSANRKWQTPEHVEFEKSS